MRRVLLLLLAGVLGAIGLMQVAPPPAGAPDFGTPTTEEPGGGGAVASPSVWYCPWVESGDIVDSDVIVVSEPTVDIGLTLLHPIANEAPEFFETELVGPGAVAIATGTVLRVGESPAVVEISNGPAATASMQYADKFISADQCIVSVPKIWYLPGGSTRTGTITQLRLFNPFADDAEVTITAYSDFGIDLVAELDGLDVAGRSWTTIDLEPYLPFRDELALTVTATRGLVIPALVRSDDRGEAMWPGTGPAETWDFPIVTAGGLEPFIAVMSAGGDDIVVAVDIITPEGAIRNAREITIESSVPGVIPLSDLAAPPFGVRVRASAPIGASVVAVVPTADPDEVGGEVPPDEDTTTTLEDTTTSTPDAPFITGLAGTVGLARPASEWFVPLDTLPDAETTMWILNAGLEPVSVVYEPLGELEYALGEPVVVAAESILGVPVDVGIGYFGYRVVADGPVTVAWTIHGQRGVAFASGIAVQ